MKVNTVLRIKLLISPLFLRDTDVSVSIIRFTASPCPGRTCFAVTGKDLIGGFSEHPVPRGIQWAKTEKKVLFLWFLKYSP